MRLYMFRHAESPPAESGQRDFDRPLTKRGIERTKYAARLLKVLEIELAYLYSSPLLRARLTAELLGDVLNIPVEIREELGLDFDIQGLTRILNEVKDGEDLMCVGHQPTFSHVVRQICGADAEIKRGGLARLDLYSINPPRGQLVWLIQPSVYELFE
ncbi:MAG: phosphohistidine phosphatase SixA [Chloroflexi bacterium OLB15]|nr:MAG: phosphohistidine phosphatase SixA [Chloroflexi bacterium OLB15]